MAKVIPDPEAPGALPRVRGVFHVKPYARGFYAAKWPRKRPGGPRSPYDYYRQEEFKIAARWASSPEPLSYETAVNMAKGTAYLPRDILMMASFGTFYAIEEEGVGFWTPARYMTNNPQYILDLVTEEVGSLLYRAEVGWIGIPPGLPGQVLVQTDAGPQWVSQAGGGGSGGPQDAPVTFGVNGIAGENYATFGNAYRALEDFSLFGFHQSLYAGTGRTFTACIATVTGPPSTPTIVSVTPFISPPLTNITFDRAASVYADSGGVVDILAGDLFMLLVSRTDSTGTAQGSPQWFGTTMGQCAAPVQCLGFGQFATTMPAAGQSPGRWVNTQSFCQSLRWQPAE